MLIRVVLNKNGIFQQKKVMLMCYAEGQKNCGRAAQLGPSLLTFRKLYTKLRKYGAFKKSRKTENIIEEASQINVFTCIELKFHREKLF